MVSWGRASARVPLVCDFADTSDAGTMTARYELLLSEKTCGTQGGTMQGGTLRQISLSSDPVKAESLHTDILGFSENQMRDMFYSLGIFKRVVGGLRDPQQSLVPIHLYSLASSFSECRN